MEEKQKSAVELYIEQLEVQGESWENVSIGRIQISIKVEDYLNLKEQAKEIESSQATEYAKWSIEIYNLTGRFFTYSEWLKDDPKDQEDYEIIKSLNVPKQSVQEYEQQGLEKYSHELAEGKEIEKERMIEFACDVYDLNYGKDKSFRKQAEDFYNKTFKNK
jgi:hypothetical protein